MPSKSLDEPGKRREVVEVLRAQRRGRLRVGGMSKGIATAILAVFLVVVTALSSGAVEELRDLLCSSVCGTGMRDAGAVPMTSGIVRGRVWCRPRRQVARGHALGCPPARREPRK
ncbi:hypothetical protein [Actinomadura litoris]|uniref:Uncharacterized protein n=1 Tax=Actinomadura litoris TaxID=2678616 RepID=A0A7K1L3B3_9ACTN|nr:hypothetical protein [Actinomadura litoris]MUN38911.1 hypothetical protein [Actinomadura litoris]